jgi:hypothetical protein
MVEAVTGANDNSEPNAKNMKQAYAGWRTKNAKTSDFQVSNTTF